MRHLHLRQTYNILLQKHKLIQYIQSPIPNQHLYNKNPEDILGFEVENSLLKDKKIQGYISKVFKNSKGDIFAQVDWDDGENTIEVVNDFNKESQISIDLICQDCGKIIKHEIDISSHLNCKGFPKTILPPTPVSYTHLTLPTN